ncbi:unnamed protein product, partial [marine sediment metagenome]
GRPVSRKLQESEEFTLEVTRIATNGVHNGCSKLYGCLSRIAKELGAVHVITYILGAETGASLRGAGWLCDGAAGGGSWSRQNRLRLDPNPTTEKTRWRKTFSSNKG